MTYSKPHIRKVDGWWEVRSKANPLPRANHLARKFVMDLNIREATCRAIAAERRRYANR